MMESIIVDKLISFGMMYGDVGWLHHDMRRVTKQLKWSMKRKGDNRMIFQFCIIGLVYPISEDIEESSSDGKCMGILWKCLNRQ